MRSRARVGKQKCRKCGGKGGVTSYIGRPPYLREIWIPCVECLGRGRWWPNNSKRKK